MAKIEFSAAEIAALKKAAEEFRKGGEEKARAALQEAGVSVEVSPAVSEMMAPSMENNSSGCVACAVCLILAALVAVSYTL